MLRPLLSVVAIFVATIVATGALAATPKDRRLVSAKYGISVEAPVGWTLSTHTGYPSILVLLLHPDGSRISVAASETQAKNAKELADLSRKALEAQEVKVVRTGVGPRDGVEVLGQYPGGREGIVQLYLVRQVASGGPLQAVVVSLVAPEASLTNQRAAMDFVVARLGLNPIASTPPPTPRPSPSPASSASAGERPAEKERR